MPIDPIKRMEERLRSEAARIAPAAPAGLADKTIAAVHRDAARSPVRLHSWQPAWLRVAAGLCLAAVIGLALQERAEEKRMTPTSGPEPLQVLRPAFEAVSPKDLPSWQRLMEAPISDELRNLRADAESAARFLVGCIPLPQERKRDS